MYPLLPITHMIMLIQKKCVDALLKNMIDLKGLNRYILDNVMYLWNQVHLFPLALLLLAMLIIGKKYEK